LALGGPKTDLRGEAVELVNDHIRFSIERERGCVSSLVDTRMRKELVVQDGGYGLGQYLRVRFDVNENHACETAYWFFFDGYVAGAFGKPGMPSASDVPHVDAAPKDFRMTVRHGGVPRTAARLR